jgi:hypothetical protein
MGGQMANVIIEGNTIKADTYGTTYSYDSCMRVGSPAYIINNNISGIASTATAKMITLIGKCTIKGNILTRGTSSILSYIWDIVGNPNTITQNTFDSTTVDGTSSKQVNLYGNSIYEKNVNQVSFTVIALEEAVRNVQNINTNYINIYSSAITSPINDYFINTSGAKSNNYVFIDDESSSPYAARHYTKAITLQNHIPAGSKVLNASVSFYYASSGTGVLNTGDNPTYLLALNSDTNLIQDNDTAANVLDIKTNSNIGSGLYAGENPTSYTQSLITSSSSTYSVTSGAAEANIKNVNKTLTLDLSSNNIYVNGINNNVFYVSLQFFKIATYSVNFIISPLVVKSVYQG